MFRRQNIIKSGGFIILLFIGSIFCNNNFTDSSSSMTHHLRITTVCPQFCKICDDTTTCSECISENYYLVEGICIDCRDPRNRENCFFLTRSQYSTTRDSRIVLELVFNQNFAALQNLTTADIYPEFN